MMNIKTALNYDEFLLYAKSQVENPVKPTDEKALKLLDFTALNIKRMERWNKTLSLSPELTELFKQKKFNQRWLLLAEAWCGDCSQNMPAIAKIAQEAGITLDILIRDENLEVMDKYLTNGGRAIPKLVAFDAEGNELFMWGARPQPARELVVSRKQAGVPWDDIEKELHTWYANNKAVVLQQEFYDLLSKC
jgi:hypothetical protein